MCILAHQSRHQYLLDCTVHGLVLYESHLLLKSKSLEKSSKLNMNTRKMLQHCGASLSEQHIALICHGTQTMNSSMVCDCLLAVRAATMATHAQTKLHIQVMS